MHRTDRETHEGRNMTAMADVTVLYRNRWRTGRYVIVSYRFTPKVFLSRKP